MSFLDALKHMLLPAFALGFGFSPPIMRVLRSSLHRRLCTRTTSSRRGCAAIGEGRILMRPRLQERLPADADADGRAVQLSVRRHPAGRGDLLLSRHGQPDGRGGAQRRSAAHPGASGWSMLVRPPHQSGGRRMVLLVLNPKLRVAIWPRPVAGRTSVRARLPATSSRGRLHRRHGRASARCWHPVLAPARSQRAESALAAAAAGLAGRGRGRAPCSAPTVSAATCLVAPDLWRARRGLSSRSSPVRRHDARHACWRSSPAISAAARLADQSRTVDVWMSFPPVDPVADPHRRPRRRARQGVLAIVLVDWTRFCRVLRSEVIDRCVRQRLCRRGEPARLHPLAASSAREVLPATVPLLITLLSLEMGIAVVVEAILSFVGLERRSQTSRPGA